MGDSPAMDHPVLRQHEVSTSLQDLASTAESLAAGPVFIIADRRPLAAVGAERCLSEILAKRGGRFHTEVRSNPSAEDVVFAADQMRAAGATSVIAFGGGSALDTAKAAAALATGHDLGQLLGGAFPTGFSPSPILAVPTTAGTGSEATHFAAIYVDRVKYSLAHPRLRPARVILDPVVQSTAPRPVRAASGLDALCQAVESLWAVGSTETSRDYAHEAIRLLSGSLLRCVRNPDMDTYRNMALGSHLTGRAIDISKTTACHAISYTLTSRFGVPHGFAVALTMAEMIRFNAGTRPEDCTDSRGVGFVRDRMRDIDEAVHPASSDPASWFDQLLSELAPLVGCPRRLSDFGAGEPEALHGVLDGIDPDRMSNNPRRLSRSALRELLGRLR